MTTNNGNFNIKRGDLTVFDNSNRNRVQVTNAGSINVRDTTGAIVTSITSSGINVNNTRIVNVGDPTNDSHATNKKYVDDGISSLAASVGSGLIVKDPVVAKLPDATANDWLGDVSYVKTPTSITNAGGIPTIDGVTLVANVDRVLIANQNPSIYWGIYILTNASTLTKVDTPYAVNNYVLVNG
jgi:hypothetical protein